MDKIDVTKCNLFSNHAEHNSKFKFKQRIYSKLYLQNKIALIYNFFKLSVSFFIPVSLTYQVVFLQQCNRVVCFNSKNIIICEYRECSGMQPMPIIYIFNHIIIQSGHTKSLFKSASLEQNLHDSHDSRICLQLSFVILAYFPSRKNSA